MSTQLKYLKNTSGKNYTVILYCFGLCSYRSHVSLAKPHLNVLDAVPASATGWRYADDSEVDSLCVSLSRSPSPLTLKSSLRIRTYPRRRQPRHQLCPSCQVTSTPLCCSLEGLPQCPAPGGQCETERVFGEKHTDRNVCETQMSRNNT